VKQIIAIMFVVGALGGTPALAADSQAVSITKARAAAENWLALTDTGKYAQSWDNAATFFRASITKPDWEKSLQSIRLSLGALKSRKFRAARFTRTLPGAPDGEYVVIQYVSQFANKSTAIETVTPMREKNGQWKVAGYYIK
jgi:hypothetical protein